jgi:hypothetical protein
MQTGIVVDDGRVDCAAVDRLQSHCMRPLALLFASSSIVV